MAKTKLILVAIAMSLVVLAVVGVTYAQYVNSQNQNNPYFSQTPQGIGGNTGYYPPSYGNGYYGQYPQQGAYPQYGMGMGGGMMGRFW